MEFYSWWGNLDLLGDRRGKKNLGNVKMKVLDRDKRN